MVRPSFFPVALIALALVGLPIPSNLTAEPLFNAPFYGADVGLFPKAAAVADFNEDGSQDLVVANIRDTASVLLGKRDGTFLPRHDIASGQFPSGVATGDMNGDGHQDIVLASSDAVYVILGNGDGTFRDKTRFSAGGTPISISLGDFNGDGRLDVVAGAAGARAVAVLLGGGDGTLGDPHFYGNLYPYALSLGDVTHDGLLDAVAVDPFTASLTVFPGNGDGTLGTGHSYAVGDTPQSLAVGDLNGDSFPDIVVGNSGTHTGTGSVSVLIGQVDGSLQKLDDLATDVWPNAVSLGDLNADGRLDLVFAGGSWSHALVYIGKGDATFTQAQDFLTAIYPHGQLLADMNADERLDLIEVDGTHQVAVHLGNGDGSFGAVAPIGGGSVDASWVALGDVNDDGRPDLAAGGYETRAVSLLFGRGDGSFGAGTPIDVGELSEGALFDDLNHDQHLDLVLRTFSSVAVFLGSGNGSFGQKARYADLTFPSGIALADLNGDDNLDLVTVSGAKVGILLGVGDGTFGEMKEYPSGEQSISPTVGDFNRDGIPDLAVCRGGPYSEAGPTAVSILLGNGDGSFQQPQEFSVPGSCSAIVCGDLNEDGILDLAVSDGSDNNVTAKAVWIAIGNGDGSFTNPVGFGDGGYAQKILTADWNGDGHLDIAVGDTRTVYILNGIGDGTFAPEGHFGGAGSSSMASSDINLDGSPDLATPADAFDAMLGIDILLNQRGPATQEARVFCQGDRRTVPIGAGQDLCVYIEPVGGGFEASAIDLSGIAMNIEGGDAAAAISPIANKHPITEDVDRNGIDDIRVCFAAKDLATVFGNLRGRQSVQVLIQGRLSTGGRFEGRTDITVVGTGRKSSQVSVWPNPFNPSGVISFETTRPGPAKVTMFDISGRLIRTLLDTQVLPLGSHEAHIDARGPAGEPLASGVYFYRIQTVDGLATGRFTILK